MQVSDKTNSEIIKILIIIMGSEHIGWPRLTMMSSPVQSSPNIKLFNFLVLTNKSTKSFTLIG